MSQLFKLCIKFENNKFPLMLMVMSIKSDQNLNIKFKGMLFKYKINNGYETNVFLAQFI